MSLKRVIGWSAASAGLIFFSASSAAVTASFHHVGFLGGSPQSICYGISADGTTAVGESIAPEGFEAFKWTLAGGMQGLGWLPNPGGFKSSQAYGVNRDGSIVVGISLSPGALLEDGSPMTWTPATGMTYLGNLGGTDTGGICQGITPDGAVIVGWCASSAGIYQPFRWTQAGGMQGLGLVPDEQIGRALAVSSDGSIIVGNISQGSTTFPKAFRWTAETGPQLMQSLNSGAISSANALTPDGAIIVGQSNGRAARWVNGVPTSLGEIPGGISSSNYWANGVSADGNRVVGMANYNAGQGTGEAFIWDPTHGMRSLKNTLLFQYGLSIPNFTLFEARAISPDGRIIVGYGFNAQGAQEGFVVDLGVSTCVGDLNGDGKTDLSDLAAQISAYGTHTGDPNYSASADLDHNGVIDLSDLAIMLGAFGCGS